MLVHTENTTELLWRGQDTLLLELSTGLREISYGTVNPTRAFSLLKALTSVFTPNNLGAFSGNCKICEVLLTALTAGAGVKFLLQ